MTNKNTPMEETLAFEIFKSFVNFQENSIFIFNMVPKEIAIFFLHNNA